jgi:hypothetical protein
MRWHIRWFKDKPHLRHGQRPTSYIQLRTVGISPVGASWTGVHLRRRVPAGIRLCSRLTLGIWVDPRTERLVGGGVAFRVGCATRLPIATTAAPIRSARSAGRKGDTGCRWGDTIRPDYQGRNCWTVVLRNCRWCRHDDRLWWHNCRGRNRAILRRIRRTVLRRIRRAVLRRIRQIGGFYANRCRHRDCHG